MIDHSHSHTHHVRGPIAWMARNSVAANLLMTCLLAGGLISGLRIKQEVFPEFELDLISISVAYPGASPAEVEQGILLAVEEEVRGLDGVKRVTSRAAEGFGTVQVELLLGANPDKALQDVKSAVDRITSFPADAERPLVQLRTSRNQVTTIVVYGDLDESVLRDAGERVREELLADPRITLVELSGVREREISVEVPLERLRAWNLTLDGIAGEIARAALELPAGGVKTPGGEILLRTAERRDFGWEFNSIPVVSRADGTRVLLGDIAVVRDDFQDADLATYFHGQRALQITVFRVGNETPLQVSAAANEIVERMRGVLPPGVQVATWADSAELFRDRMYLLLRNFAFGLTLVFVILGLFLEPRLAFWVTMGIPVSLLGSMMLIPWFQVSINMISLFAFIVTLGIVVDDAIVSGENIYEMRGRTQSYLDAAVHGARRISMPVVFSVLTNVTAFLPLFFIPGFAGKMWWNIPAVVIPVFMISLVESLFVLPAHLGHQHPPREHGLYAACLRVQQRFAAALAWFVRAIYAPALGFCLRNRYATLAGGIAILLLTVGFVAGGRIKFSFFPRVDTDVAIANLTLPFGSPVAETEAAARRLEQAALAVLAEHGGAAITRGLLTTIGAVQAFGPRGGTEGSGGHQASVAVYMVPSDQRPITASAFVNAWRARVGDLVGVESLVFRSTAGGPSAGAAIDIELSHTDRPTLERAARELARALESFSGVRDIDDGFLEGKTQFNFRLRPQARAQGLTTAELARQLRGAFYGAEALRQQRGRDELRVYVRLPQSERRAEQTIEQLMIRLPGGGEMPLTEAAEIERGRAYTSITRVDGRRTINVTADIVEGQANANEVVRGLEQRVLPDLLARYDGLSYTKGGEQREQAESLAAMRTGFVMSLLGIFALMAIPLKSYIQPTIIMTAIPFGIVGAVIGHALLGYELSIMSLVGIVALAGVAVNDSLVLVVTANEHRREGGLKAADAVTAAGMRRFRPILLTSLTTFGGLAPMIFETSVQARFLIPMAISLGFGVLFCTLITLVLVPSIYLIVDDLRRIAGVVEAMDDEE